MDKKKLLQQKVRMQQLIVNAAKEGKRDLSIEEQREFEDLQQEIDGLRSEIEKENGSFSGSNESQRAVEAERQRISSIYGLCKTAAERGIEIEAHAFIERGSSVEEVNKELLKRFMENGAPSNTPSSHVKINADENDKFRSAASDSILMRGGILLKNPTEGARDLRGMRLRALAIDCVQRSGCSKAQRLSDDELLRRALSPDSQFGAILSDSVNKSMAAAYNAQSTTYQAWTGVGSVTDFKGATHYQISEGGNLEKMTQTGEFKFDEMTDSKATRSIATYGKKFGFTRQAMVNDDLGILVRIPQAYVRSAGRGINKLVYDILKNNAAIYDGQALFGTEHKNLASTGEAISVATLGAAKAAMRKQTNLKGIEKLNIQPKFLIVSPDKEVEAMQVIHSISDPSQNNANVTNVFKNSLSIVVDAELEGNAWYLAASPVDIDTIMVSYLNGDAMPKLESRVGFDYLGMEWRIYMDYGVDVLDFRGLYKNNGNN